MGSKESAFSVWNGYVVRDAVRAGEGAKVIVEAMIFFHYYDDTLYRRHPRHEGRFGRINRWFGEQRQQSRRTQYPGKRKG